MRPVEVVRQALERRGSTTKGPDHNYMAQCPSHDDGRPSLHVTEGTDGKAVLRCFANCEAAVIVADAGLEWSDLFPDDGKRSARDDDWTPEAEYLYTDADGNPVMKVIRFPGKRFRQQRWTGSEWVWKLDGVTRQLFRLPEVLAAKARGDWVFVTEGEKDALAVVAAGKCATTMPGGAGKWEPQYTEALTGANVCILADDDEPGLAHAAAVFQKLFGHAGKVGIRLPAAGHKDIADHLAAGLSLNGDLRRPAIARDIPVAASSRSALTAAVFASRPGSDKALEVVGPLFQRGMRTVIGAQTGEGKTTFTMQAIRSFVEGAPFLDERWIPRGTGRALIVDLEQGEETIKHRLREAGLAGSERVDILWEPNGIALDKREEDREMLRSVLSDGGYDMVVLDPLYQLHLGPGNSEEIAAAVMRHVDGWAREFNVALVIPMHMRKPHPDAGSNITIHDIAGSSTWLRNAEFVMGLQVMYAGASRVHFFKDRVGRGPETRSFWWMDFTRDSGYQRNFKERTDRVKRDLKKLLNRPEGATRDELVAHADGNELLVQELVKKAHVNGDRYRAKKWEHAVDPNQQTFMAPGTG
jgi:hypothetical protein